jgi:hypothetical protein
MPPTKRRHETRGGSLSGKCSVGFQQIYAGPCGGAPSKKQDQPSTDRSALQAGSGNFSTQTADSLAHWLTTPVVLPNSKFFTDLFNIVYGAYKVADGLVLFESGSAADVTGFGATLGVPAQGYGAYQAVTGVFRAFRGIRQVSEATQDQTVFESPLDYGKGIRLETVVPGGSTTIDWLGALP